MVRPVRRARPALGGKNAGLRCLTPAGFPVPPGFAVTTAAYRQVIGAAGLTDRLATLTADQARAAILDAGVPGWLTDQLGEAYQELCRRCATPDAPVAVRSSATGEDGSDASFAGMHDTFLGVRSLERIVERMVACWASLYCERAVAYQERMPPTGRDPAMSVGIQHLVRPRAAGVALTLDPLDGDRSVVLVEAAWGFGEAVVAGAVTPDVFTVDRRSGEIRRRVVSVKAVEYRLGPTGVHAAPVERDRRAGPCLGDDEARAVAELAARVEELFDAPQDVEWAIAEEAAPGAGLDPGRSPLVLNDHSDPAYDGDVLRRLTTRHTATVALLDRGTGLAPGLAGFGERLTEAVPAVTAGHPERFVAPTADSYYHVWMELHEHLLSAFSRTRGEGDA